MGLDITYYRNMKRIEVPADIVGDALWDWRDANGTENYFALEGMEDRLEGAPSGWYEAEEAGDFRAGSYGGYNAWRALLCRVMLGVEPEAVWNDPDKWHDQPFYGLINFADNEGCIGPVWSARLAQQFTENRERFAKHPDVGEYELGKYDAWAEAFKTAANNGFVAFH